MTTNETAAMIYLGFGFSLAVYRHVQYIRALSKLMIDGGDSLDPLDWVIAALMFVPMWALWLPMELTALFTPRRKRRPR